MTDTNIDTIDEEKGFDRFNDSDADIPKEEGPKSSVSLNQDYISASNNILLSRSCYNSPNKDLKKWYKPEGPKLSKMSIK